MYKFFLLVALLAPPAFAIEGKKQAEVVVAIPNRIVTLDPTGTVVAQDRFILPLIFEYLVEADPYGEIKNRLISSWEFKKESQTLHLFLAKGLKFSDGSDLTADDVVETFKLLCKPGSPSADQFIGLRNCGQNSQKSPVYKGTNNSVVFPISIHPNAFLYQLAYGRGPIFKKTKDGKLVGSGPFKLANCQAENCLLEINSFSQRKSSVELIRFIYIRESELSKSVNKADFQVAAMYLQPNFRKMQLGSYNLVVHSPNVTEVIVLNPNKYPFNDARIRKAFREKVYSSKIAKCKELPLANGFIPRGVPGSLDARPATQVDDIKVKSANVIFYRHSGRMDLCEEHEIIQAGSKLGITIRFQYLDDYPELLKKYFDQETSGYVELNPFVSRDPSSILRRFMPGSKDGLYFYSDIKIEKLINQALMLPTVSERIAIYKDINKMIYEHASVIPVVFISHTVLVGHCLNLKSIDLNSYNPNSFLYLLDLEKKQTCEENAT